MFNIIHALYYYLKRILFSGYTYFFIGMIFLLVFANDFRKQHETPIKEISSREKIVNYALSLKGIDYRSGGINTAGFDCSGFTYFVYKKFGYTLPRSSQGQFEAGKSIAVENLALADLIFFKGSNKHSDQIGHVGIVISESQQGNLAFVHASSSKGVRIDSLNTNYYQERFLGTRRIFNHQN